MIVHGQKPNMALRVVVVMVAFFAYQLKIDLAITKKNNDNDLREDVHHRHHWKANMARTKIPITIIPSVISRTVHSAKNARVE